MDSLERQTQFHLEGVVAIVAMVTVAKLCLGNCCGHGGRHCGRRHERSLLLHDCQRLVRGGAHASSPPQSKTSWGCVCFSFCREQNDFTHTGRSRRMSEQVWRIKECLTETRWTTWVCDLSPHTESCEGYCGLYSTLKVSHNASLWVMYNQGSLSTHCIPSCIVAGVRGAGWFTGQNFMNDRNSSNPERKHTLELHHRVWLCSCYDTGQQRWASSEGWPVSPLEAG